MPATTTILTGGVVRLLLGSSDLLALVAANAIRDEQFSPEAVLPTVLIEDPEDDSIWPTAVNRIETHRLKVTIRANETNTPGARKPAEVIADLVESILNWEDIALANGILTTTVPIAFLKTKKRRSLEKRRSASAGRVYRIELNWLVRFERSGAP
jgi:hypothetical protein